MSLVKNRFALVILLILVPAVLMAQGYYNQENFGNRSLLLSGTVTGSVDDLGLTYYNPARIALIEDPIFSINAKAYQFSTLSLNNVFGVDSKLSDSKFEGVPSLLAGTFKLGSLRSTNLPMLFFPNKEMSCQLMPAMKERKVISLIRWRMSID